MNREDFLNVLRLELQRQLGHKKTKEYISWYEEHILINIRKGNDEAEVLAELGDPRLLANSIIAKERALCDNVLEADEEWSEETESHFKVFKIIKDTYQRIRDWFSEK